MAHLDKRTGQLVLCGRCGNAVGRIKQHPVRSDRYVVLPTGYQPRGTDGAWTPTRHAQERMRRGRPPGFRGKPRPRVGLPSGDRTPGDDAYVNWNRPGRLSGTLLDQLPARVVCPTCGAIPWLTADKLRAQPYVVGGAILTAVDGVPVSETRHRTAAPTPGVLYVDL